MRKGLLKLILFLVLITPVSLVFGQQLLAKSKQVQSVYSQFLKNPKSQTCQLNYIEVFPDDTTQFLRVFASADFGQLYQDSYNYIEDFFKLGKYHTVLVINKSIDIGKNLRWEADAVGYLQHGIVALGNKYTSLFILKINSLSPDEQSNLITFLADVENHDAYPEYKQLIKSIKAARRTDLADKFITAMNQREKQHHD